MEEKDGAFVLGWRGEEHGEIAVGCARMGTCGLRWMNLLILIEGEGERRQEKIRATAPASHVT